ncbi:hypothetical protein ACSS6W_001459 [Trichoderma asperelloides]
MAKENDHAAHLKPAIMYKYGDGQCEVGLVAISIYPSTINKRQSGAYEHLINQERLHLLTMTASAAGRRVPRSIRTSAASRGRRSDRCLGSGFSYCKSKARVLILPLF